MNLFFVSVLAMSLLWGLIEITLGFFLHELRWVFTHLSSGSILYPIGSFFMFAAYKKTGRASSMLMVALLSAGIKCLNFLVPGINPVSVMNPVIAIILEGLVNFLVVVTLYPKVKDKFTLSALFNMGAYWLYFYAFSLLKISHPKSLHFSITSIILSGIIAGLITAFFFKLIEARKEVFHSGFYRYSVMALVSFVILCLDFL